MTKIHRSLVKTITWRIIGTLDTMIISAIITGSFSLGLSIGGIEIFTKMILYFLHERIWEKINLKNIKTKNVLHHRKNK